MNSIGRGIATLGFCGLGVAIAFKAPEHLVGGLVAIACGTFFIWATSSH